MGYKAPNSLVLSNRAPKLLVSERIMLPEHRVIEMKKADYNWQEFCKNRR